MTLFGKRTRSALRGPISVRKRQCFSVSSPALPRSTILLSKTNKLDKKSRNQGSCYSYSSSDDAEGDFDCDAENYYNTECYTAAQGEVRFGQAPKLDPRLLEAVSKYSDSELVNKDAHQKKEYLTLQGSANDRNYNLFNIRKGLSKHPSFSIASARQRQIPRSDTAARERCFDYLLQSIDEVWGRYCNTTSTAENEVYDRLGSSVTAPFASVGSPNSSFYSQLNIANPRHRSDPSEDDLSDSGYKSEVTNPTEYETDCDYRKVSKLPQSMRLQSLKDRLVKAKNDLENSYDTNDWSDCMYFWRRWDMIKYSAVEMMEEDDDDDIIESVIDELEHGRCYIDA